MLSNVGCVCDVWCLGNWQLWQPERFTKFKMHVHQTGDSRQCYQWIFSPYITQYSVFTTIQYRELICFPVSNEFGIRHSTQNINNPKSGMLNCCELQQNRLNYLHKIQMEKCVLTHERTHIERDNMLTELQQTQQYFMF